MVREIFRNFMFYKDDTSIDFNIMKDKANPSYSLLLIKIFNKYYNELMENYNKQ